MTAGEYLFLALGLLLGTAGGATLSIVLRSRPPVREIRVTVAPDAVPRRRPATLATDAFVTAPAEPARGGPADRRWTDRPEPVTGERMRTPVPFAGPDRRVSQPATIVAAGPATATAHGTRPPYVGIPVVPEPDPDLAALRASLAIAAERALQAGQPTLGSILESSRPAAGPPGAPIAVATGERTIDALLRGDRRALGAVLDAVAGADLPTRRRWHAALLSLMDELREAAIRAGHLDFPAGEAFWEPLTREQARDVARALAALGFNYDGRGGWAGNRAPSQRDLAAALGYAGLDPRRVRTWPAEDEVAGLFREVSVLVAEYVADVAPDLSRDDLRTALGHDADRAADLWAAWDRVRPALLAPLAA